MSEPLRIAAAVEGPTDTIVLRAILRAVLQTDFHFQTLQPEGSAAFGSSPSSGTGGWVGVYRWSRQSASESGGSVSGSSALSHHDVLIVHVDADVAGKTYASGGVRDAPRDDLPCEAPCPPPDDTTNALRAVVLDWLGEDECPSRIVLCTPSRSTEAWVLAALWPEGNVVRRCDWECRASPPTTSTRGSRKATWFGETTGSVATIRMASSPLCPKTGGSGNARTTTGACNAR